MGCRSIISCGVPAFSSSWSAPLQEMASTRWVAPRWATNACPKSCWARFICLLSASSPRRKVFSRGALRRKSARSVPS
eukprot:11173_4